MDEIKIICAEILNGYSVLENKEFGQIFVKHFGPLDSSIFDVKKIEFSEKAKKQSLQTAQEKEIVLTELELWDSKKNLEIQSIENYLRILRKTKEKQIIQQQIDIYNKTIAEEEAKLNKLQNEKSELLGFTVESYTDRRLSEYYIYKAFFSSLESKTPFFTIDNYEDLDRSIIHILIKEYNDLMGRFSEINLKKVALLPYFYNLFIVSNDDIFKFFGKPILHLTFYQVEIFRHAMFFKKIFENSKATPPDDVLQNPERLLEWFNSLQNAEELVGESEEKTGKVSGIAGATDQDYKRLGLAGGNEDFVDYFKEAEKRGGSLNLIEIAKMHQQK